MGKSSANQGRWLFCGLWLLCAACAGEAAQDGQSVLEGCADEACADASPPETDLSDAGSSAQQPDDVGSRPDAAVLDEDAAVVCDGINCPCEPGFEATANGCEDVDECAVDNGGCGAQAQCVNQIGAPASCECPDGLTDRNGDASSCIGTLAVGLGNQYACAISDKSDLHCWGEGRYGVLGNGTRDRVLTPRQIGEPGLWSKVVAGDDHACGIRDGLLYCWGNRMTVGDPNLSEDALEPQRVGPDYSWSSIASAAYSTCAISTGQLFCWGWNPVPPTSSSSSEARQYLPELQRMGTLGLWQQIAAGRDHYCGIQNGGLFCFGYAGPDAFGEGTAIDPFTRIGAESDWVQVAAGASQTCAIRDHELYCWGTGYLGNGVSETLRRPTRVGTERGWDAIATSNTSCGIRDGGMYCWGYLSSDGEDGVVRERVVTPTRIGDDSDWTAVETYDQTMCGLRGKTLYCWGDDLNGQLARGFDSRVPVPTRVDDADDCSEVSSGMQSCGVRPDGVYCWGQQYEDEVSNVHQYTFRSEPTLLEDGAWSHLSTGDVYGCAERNGELKCWGFLNRVHASTDPETVSSAQRWDVLTSGYQHACGLSNGSLYCWGSNDSRQLGDPTLSLATAPARIGTSTSWTAVSASVRSTCGVMDGGMYCWGSSWLPGTLGTVDSAPSAPSRVGTGADWTDVSTGPSHRCALSRTLLYCWGNNSSGQLGTGDLTEHNEPKYVSSDWSAVSAGSGHTCGLRGGALYCWGDNRARQLGDGSTVDYVWTPSRVDSNSDWTAVSAYGSHTCAIRQGSIYCWGDNTYGESGGPLPWSDTPVRVDVGP